MSQYTIYEKDEYRQCPYDDTHMILAFRYQNHLNNCRRNHPHAKVEHCRFNHTHVVKQSEIRQHEASCRDKGRIAQDLASRSGIQNGISTVEAHYPDKDWAPPKSTESWDDDEDMYKPKLHPIVACRTELPGGPLHSPNAPLTLASLRELEMKKKKQKWQDDQWEQMANVGRGSGHGVASLPAQQPSKSPFGRGRARIPDPIFEGHHLISNGDSVWQDSIHDNLDLQESNDCVDLNKTERKLRKKLREIENLKEKMERGISLSENEEKKLNDKMDVEKQLSLLYS